MSEATCTKCGKHIIWAVSDKGAKVPLDPRALVFEVWQDGGTLRCAPADKQKAMVSHFATCPAAAEFSGRNSKPASTPADSSGIAHAKGKARYEDGDQFPFGKFGPKGAKPKTFGTIPSYYLTWFLEQSWASEWPGVVEYCRRNASALDKEESESDQRREEREEPPESASKPIEPDNIPF